MGTTMSAIGLANKPPALPPAKNNNNKAVCISRTPPDYKFEHFMKLCQNIQDEKKKIQVQIRMEVLNWRKRAQNGNEVDECREQILAMLSRFRSAQEKQDHLIEKEKLRLDAFRNCINEDTTNRIKSRLTFFCRLNRQHEALLELVRQDVQDCKNICRRYQDTHSQPSKSKGFETWIKCPKTPAYDFGSIGSL
ncbi:hypothetical protein QZH41_008404 [Actinostola sp. cb2023]|nr:hypothetical protein QZH41_008404 [Actinostola sp. cb2023]